MRTEAKGLVWDLAAITFIAVSIFGGMVFIAAFVFR
jgi:hypothetical protein